MIRTQDQQMFKLPYCQKKIKSLTDHLKHHHKDFISRRGLLSMVGKRRNLLSYIKNKNETRYSELIKSLGLRR